LAGSRLTPVAFSFDMGVLSYQLTYGPCVALGWVAYAMTAIVSAIGENKLMPSADFACVVVNSKTGYVETPAAGSLAAIGRIVQVFLASSLTSFCP